MPIRSLCLIWLAALLVSLCPAAASADSWMPPSRSIYTSPDRQFRFTVDPRETTGPLDFFKDKVKGKEPAGQRRGRQDKPQGLLERKGSDGRWVTVWAKPLVNDVSPVSALVSDDGRHVVTFDNWHSMGWGADAVAIYGPDGGLVRALALIDILPADYVEALPRSVSSIHWGGKHSLSRSGDRLLLEIVIPSVDDNPSADRQYMRIEVELATGRVAPPAGPEWDGALIAAKRANANARQSEEARKQALIAPLLGPATSDEREWHDYLVEAFFRIDAQWMEDFPSNTVLRDRAAKNYKASEGWVRDALLDKHMIPGAIALAAPTSPEDLVRLLTEAASKLKPDALKEVRIYVAVGDAWRDRVAAALAPTGARFIQLDPARPIPQRKERVPGSAEEKQAREERDKQMTAMMDELEK